MNSLHPERLQAEEPAGRTPGVGNRRRRDMGAVLLDMAVSLDGFICGPGGSDGGLYDWYFDPTEFSRTVVDELVDITGALIIGRGAFGTGDEAGGWDDTPYQVPHFVVTHRPLPPSPGRAVTFVGVPEGVRTAVERARDAAGDRYATIGGGADIARQCLAEGLVDEVQLHLVPVLLGDGVRLFDRDGQGCRLTKTRVIDAPNVTHVRYRVDRAGTTAPDEHRIPEPMDA
jgi:dihydrofolate reductase